MSLFTLHAGRATPTTRDDVLARLTTFGPGVYDAPGPGHEKDRWVVVDVLPDEFEEDVAFTAGELAKRFTHLRDWKDIYPMAASDHLPVRNPVHREASAFVLTHVDLGAIVAGEYHR